MILGITLTSEADYPRHLVDIQIHQDGDTLVISSDACDDVILHVTDDGRFLLKYPTNPDAETAQATLANLLEV